MNKIQFQGYHTLIELCVSDNRRPELHLVADRLRSQFADADPHDALGEFCGHLDENGIHFIMGLDWKADIVDLVWRVQSALKDNFETVIQLPSVQNYPDNASVGRKHVFPDFDNAIRPQGFQIGFIDTQSDEYVILVFRISDAPEVREAVNQIGYDYMDIQSHSGKLDHLL